MLGVGDTKCGIYKPKWGIYTPWVIRRGTLVHSLGSMNLSLMILHNGIKIKRPAHLSIVERLGGFWCCKGKTFIWIVQGFWKKSAELEVIFNSCCVLGRAKCGVYKPKWVDYKPYWGMWKDGTNFVAFLSFAPEIVRNGVYNC